MIHGEYTCYTAQKELTEAANLIKHVMHKAENKMFKASLKLILQSLKPVIGSTVHLFYKKDENSKQELFK